MYIYHYLDPPLLSITPSPHLSPLRANTNVDVDTLNRTYPVFLGIFKFQFISRRSPLPYLFASYFDACCSSGYLIILSVFFFFPFFHFSWLVLRKREGFWCFDCVWFYWITYAIFWYSPLNHWYEKAIIIIPCGMVSNIWYDSAAYGSTAGTTEDRRSKTSLLA